MNLKVLVFASGILLIGAGVKGMDFMQAYLDQLASKRTCKQICRGQHPWNRKCKQACGDQLVSIQACIDQFTSTQARLNQYGHEMRCKPECGKSMSPFSLYSAIEEGDEKAVSLVAIKYEDCIRDCKARWEQGLKQDLKKCLDSSNALIAFE